MWFFPIEEGGKKATKTPGREHKGQGPRGHRRGPKRPPNQGARGHQEPPGAKSAQEKDIKGTQRSQPMRQPTNEGSPPRKSKARLTDPTDMSGGSKERGSRKRGVKRRGHQVNPKADGGHTAQEQFASASRVRSGMGSSQMSSPSRGLFHPFSIGKKYLKSLCKKRG